jgi:dihydrofolate synthase / folylpolyglutamate synthase
MPAEIENYEQAVEYLFGRINYERLAASQYSAEDLKLDRMRGLLGRLGNPQDSLPTVHVAGTKGKGSTAAMIAKVLSAAGFRTGLFTSPHIKAFEERMAVDGVIPSPQRLVALINGIAGAVAEQDRASGRESPTYFEITTALAWMYFREQKAQIAVLETGMGGRLDATNVCRPDVAVITSISRDHTRQLGSRVAQIAGEKAGIIKPGRPVVCGVTAPEALAVIEATCRERGAPWIQIGRDFDYRYGAPRFALGGRLESPATLDVRTPGHVWSGLALPLVGEHQAHNAAVALAAIDELMRAGWAISEKSVPAAIAQIRWPGRIELLGENPAVIVDTAHNWAAVQALVRTLDESFAARRRLLVFAAARDKDVSGMLRQLLPRFDAVVLTSVQNNPRIYSAAELAEIVRGQTEAPVHVADEAAAAWKLARRLAGPQDLICVTGSFFIAAELRELILEAQRTLRPEFKAEDSTARLENNRIQRTGS